MTLLDIAVLIRGAHDETGDSWKIMFDDLPATGHPSSPDAPPTPSYDDSLRLQDESPRAARLTTPCTSPTPTSAANYDSLLDSVDAVTSTGSTTPTAPPAYRDVKRAIVDLTEEDGLKPKPGCAAKAWSQRRKRCMSDLHGVFY